MRAGPFELVIWHLYGTQTCKKKGLHSKNVTCLHNEKKSIAPISLIQMTSEKPSHFAFKTRIENCKGDVNAWSRGLFQLADRDFPHECPDCYCFLNPVST